MVHMCGAPSPEGQLTWSRSDALSILITCSPGALCAVGLGKEVTIGICAVAVSTLLALAGLIVACTLCGQEHETLFSRLLSMTYKQHAMLHHWLDIATLGAGAAPEGAKVGAEVGADARQFFWPSQVPAWPSEAVHGVPCCAGG